MATWADEYLTLLDDCEPRVQVVGEVTATTFTLEERRMTWAEWRPAVWRALVRAVRG